MHSRRESLVALTAGTGLIATRSAFLQARSVTAPSDATREARDAIDPALRDDS